MRFLFISRRGASLSLAKRVADEGHIVKFYIHNSNYKKVGSGIITKAVEGEFHNSDIIIFDEAGLGEYANKMAKSKPVLGASLFADLFNTDIDYKKEVLKRCKLELSDKKGKVIYITGWHNGFSYVRPFHSFFKKTKFMENDLSVDTECQGVLLFYHKANKLAKETLYKLRSELKKIGYKGAITFKCSITSEGMAINDVHFGFEYDSTYTALEGLRQPLGETLYRMAFDSIKRVKASSDWLAGLRISIPPYPFPMTEQFSTPITIKGISLGALKHLWFRDVAYENGEYVSAGSDSNLMAITARGLSPRKAFCRTYRTINNLSIKNVQYRRDLENGLEERYNLIKKWGWFN